MTSRLTNRSDTPIVTATDRASDRIMATQTTCRLKATKHARTEHLSTRTTSRAAKTVGASMDYQQGFTSGPSV